VLWSSGTWTSGWPGSSRSRPLASAAEALEGLTADAPLVTVDGDPERPFTGVTVDQAAGARTATEHLLAAGHRTVWHVSGPADWFDRAGCVAGWEAALRGGRRGAAGASRDWSAATGYRVGQTPQSPRPGVSTATRSMSSPAT
jgi:DNA-binding LacI/PurR family transcriptional regulator